MRYEPRLGRYRVIWTLRLSGRKYDSAFRPLDGADCRSLEGVATVSFRPQNCHTAFCVTNQKLSDQLTV